MLSLVPVAHAGRVADAPSAATIASNTLTAMLTFAGTIGIIAIVIAGTVFLFSRGNERLQQTATRAMWQAVVGMLAIMAVMVVIQKIAALFVGGR